VEAFEQFCAVAMQAEGLVVSSGVKFPVRRKTNKTAHVEFQTHGYEVDLIGARADRLILATVKSFFGSRGVVAEQVTGRTEKNRKLYALLNDPEIRNAVVTKAAKRYGYRVDQVRLRLYVGKFARTGQAEDEIRAWCSTQHVGAGAIEVMNLEYVIEKVRSVARAKTYINDPIVVSMKVLAAAKVLDLDASIAAPADVDLDDGPNE
jgi:hypothetical protein